MILGMTRAELGLVVFVFLLIYGAGFLTRIGAFLGGLFSGGAREAPEGGPDSRGEPPSSTKEPG